jgi:hypothetical protein
MKTPATILALLLLVLLTACGYKLGAPETALAGVSRSLSIPVFDNETAVIGAGAVFTREAREVFARGGYKLIGEDQAEFRLLGRILTIETPPGTRRFADSGPQVGSYDLSVTLHLKLVDVAGMVLWEMTVTDRDDSFGAATLGSVRANRDEALVRLARRLLERVYREMGEGN